MPTPSIFQQKKYFRAETAEKVLEQFDVRAEYGLSSQEAVQRLRKYGLNELPKVKKSIWRLYFAPFLENALIIIYLIAGATMLVLSLVLNIHDFSSLTFYIVMINVFFAIFQQIRAQISIDALRRFIKETCTVIRDGRKQIIEIKFLVPGDILDIQEGNKIPADARLFLTNDFYTNESSISGESFPVAKDANPQDSVGDNYEEMTNYVFMGTYATKGNARAIVVATGRNSEIGNISQNLTGISAREIPLQRKINNFAKYLAVLVGIMFLLNLIYKTSFRVVTSSFSLDLFLRDLYESLNVAVKFMPINIILLVTIILFTGVLSLGTVGVIVRNLTALESLGRVSVICTDKTGTLTQNETTVTHVYADGKIFDITGIGYSKEGSVEFDGRKIGIDDLQASETLRMLVLCGLIDNNAEITEEDYKITIHKRQIKPLRKVIGDPMEAALIVLAEKMGIQRQKQFGFIKEFPFDAVLKRMTKIWSLNSGEGDGGVIAFSKGATEIILDLSTNLMENSSEIELDQNHKSDLLAQISSWSEKGYRTLGLAFKHLETNNETKTLNRAEIEKGLTFLGFVVLLDPIRQGVKEAVKMCKSAGIKVVMITGDHPKTAETIGSELEIFAKGDLVVEGKDISMIDAETFFRTTIFARVSPGGKQFIVKRYQDAGKVVAMTGDGVNDALALGMADAGLAMGISGTDVAKEAADMIISDDSFSTIVKGIHTGRGLFAKIRVIIYFFVYANLTEAMFIFITGFINPNFYLIDPNIQIYIIYGLSHALIPFGLTFDRTGPYVMAEKPRNEEEIFNKNILLLMAVHIILLAIGLLVGASFVISAFYANPVASDLNNVLAEPRTITIGIILFIEVLTAFSIRRQNIPLLRTFMRNDMGPFFVLMAEVALGAFIFCVYIPFFQKLFLLAPLTATDWLIIFGVGLPTLPILELVKWFMRVKKKLFF